MPNFTSLSTLLNRMDRWTVASVVEETYKVDDLDNALRDLRSKTLFPWNLKQSTLRVFSDVLVYPVATDHDELAFFDNDSKSFSLKPQTKFTSIKEFYENPDTQNDLAEIWDNGTRFIGLRYQTRNASSQKLSDAEDATDFSVSGDVTAVADETVVYKEGNGSVRVTIVNATNTATITNTFTSFSDSDYKRKYHFKWIYLDAVPTSIALRLLSSAGNYLGTTSITTQFSGQALKADAWNLIAQDLNTATETGAFNSATISSEQVVLTGAATGTYYIDSSYLRAWELLDYWYYSRYLCATVNATAADQEFFKDSSGVYSNDTRIVADSEWVNLLVYTALLDTVSDKENANIYSVISKKQQQAMLELEKQYPHMRPSIHTQYYGFIGDHMSQYYQGGQD